jgi:glycosyltransferase involved in cell wall biosynthesis
MLLKQSKDLSYKNLYLPSKNTIYGGLRDKKNYNKKKIFTIITVVLNNAKYIEDTIKSVIIQNNENIEYIIIDGGSTDGTVDIINKFNEDIDLWISEKDNGIYDAMNKGLIYSTGKYIGIINSGDLYEHKALSIIENYFNKNTKLDFIFGTVNKKKIKYGFNKKKIFWSFDFYPSHSSGFFILNDTQKKVGLYNIDFKLSADHDLFFRLIKNNYIGTSTKKEELIGHFRKLGGSYSSKFSNEEHLLEEIKIRLHNKQGKLMVLMIILNNYLKNIFKPKKYYISVVFLIKTISNVFYKA